jgi:hypothetical protein
LAKASFHVAANKSFYLSPIFLTLYLSFLTGAEATLSSLVLSDNPEKSPRLRDALPPALSPNDSAVWFVAVSVGVG